jgi:hypothetical protein
LDIENGPRLFELIVWVSQNDLGKRVYHLHLLFAPQLPSEHGSAFDDFHSRHVGGAC